MWLLISPLYLQNYTPTVDESVPELTWESIDASGSNSPNTDAATNSAAVHDSNFHLIGHNSRSSGGRPRTTTQIWTRSAIINSVRSSSSSNCGKGISPRNVLLPHFRTSPAGLPPRFSVHSHTSSAVWGFMESRASGSNSAVAAMKSVDCRSGGAASLGGRVLPLLL